MATADGTWGYRDRFGDSFGRTFFRRFPPGVCSSVGIGTYLGAPTDAVDDQYRAAIETALEHGINHIDTAVNYRCQRSERVVGEVLESTAIDREAIVVATKGGFLPFDGERPADPSHYVREQFIEPGIVDPQTLVRGSHSLDPNFIDEMLDRSLSNLGLETIDCYYLHNPETQLLDVDRESLYDQLDAAFELLERRRAAGDIGVYGLATWQAFRVPQSHQQYLSLPEVLDRAAAAADRVGAADHGLKAIQLPFNVDMADAFTVESQPTNEGPVSVLEYAHESNLSVVTSASIGQGDLSIALPPAVDAELSGDTVAQRAINFARSAPGVTTSLVGMRSTDHVAENIAAGTFDPLGAAAFDAVFE
jgi:aryl-alcohol dehydrogenase-like predicted oxidoreductase